MDRDRVLEATDLVALISEHVRLQPKGSEFVGLCPFHDDKKPSMHVVPAKGFYHCFACGEHGNAIDFLINFHKMDFRSALEALANRAGIELTARRPQDREVADRRTQLLRANERAFEFYRRTLRESDGETAKALLAERGISQESIERFGIGLAPDSWDSLKRRIEEHGDNNDRVPSLEIFEAAGLLRMSRRNDRIDYFRNRLIFPIRDELGRPIAFGARRIDPDEEPKYLNSPETEVFSKSSTLYGLDIAGRAIARTKTAIICEGYTDVIALHAAGFENAVATLGTALTREHAQRLSKFCDRIVLLFDGDAAGQRAADRSIEVFFSFPVDVRICTLPDKLDPDELLRQDGGHERFEQAVNQATDALESMVSVFRQQLDAADGVTARTRIVESTLARLSSLGMDDLSTIRRRFVVDSIAEILRVSPAEIERMAAPTRSRFQTAESDEMMADDLPREPVVRAPMAQRAAEEQLLQLILADPTVALEHVRFDDDTTMNVVEKFPPSRLEDPLCRMAWESIRERAVSGELPDGPDLVAGVADDEAGRLASKLYLDGLRQLETSGEPTIRLLELASNQLESLIGVMERRAARTEATTRPISDPDEALEALNAIRAAGFDPTTVPKIPGQDPPQPTDHGQYA